MGGAAKRARNSSIGRGRPHSAYFDGAASFAVTRGGRIDLTVLGAWKP